MVPNPHKVPQRQWRKWSDTAKRVFNEMYALGFNNQDIFAHPKAPKFDAEHWKTVAWNFAWVGADAVDEHNMAPGDQIQDITPAGTVKKTRIVK